MENCPIPLADHSLVIDNIATGIIKKSPLHGYGLFAECDLAEDQIICVLDGQVMDWDFYDELVKARNLSEVLTEAFFMEWNALSPNTLLVRPFRTKYSFINHSRTPNLRISGWPLRVVAARTIEAGEELLLDYRKEPLRKEYLEGHGSTFL